MFGFPKTWADLSPLCPDLWMMLKRRRANVLRVFNANLALLRGIHIDSDDSTSAA